MVFLYRIKIKRFFPGALLYHINYILSTEIPINYRCLMVHYTCQGLYQATMMLLGMLYFGFTHPNQHVSTTFRFWYIVQTSQKVKVLTHKYC